MKTDELIAVLANGAEEVEPRALQRRYAVATGWGAFVGGGCGTGIPLPSIDGSGSPNIEKALG